MGRHLLFFLVVCLTAGCNNSSSSVDEYNTSPLKLPDGTVIRVETMARPEDMMRGMMFRESLPENRGMLFVHGSPGLYPYWMHQVKVPLDIIWLDHNKRIVEIVPGAPPCPVTGKEAQERCPNFGGHQPSQYVVELASGMVRKHNLKFGDGLAF